MKKKPVVPKKPAKKTPPAKACAAPRPAAVKTARKRPIGRPFVKGDPRANTKGRPPVARQFKELRSKILDLLASPASDGKTPVLEAFLRNLIADKSPAARKLVLEYGFGKVPEEIKMEHSGKTGIDITVKFV